jgi:DNA modification methylase
MKPYYEHGGVTLYHGDCREVLPQLAPCSTDACLTSPPYNVRKPYPCDDWPSWDDYFAFVRAVYSDIRRVVVGPVAYLYPFSLNAEQNGALMVPWGRDGIPWKRVRLVLRHEAVDDSKSLIAMPPRGEVLVCDQWAEENAAKIWYVPHAKFGIDHGSGGMSGDHPAPFHPRLVSKFLEMFPSAQSLLDPFAGTGTTLYRAKQLGLRAVGVEIEERFCEVAVKRLAQETLFGDTTQGVCGPEHDPQRAAPRAPVGSGRFGCDDHDECLQGPCKRA